MSKRLGVGKGGRPRALCVAAMVATSSTFVLAGCGPTITMPDVVGMRLDDAHRALEAMGVDHFDDTDVVGEEDVISLDINWVVVSQEPKPGTTNVDTGSTIRLSVGNEDEDEVLDMIPADSDFATEVASQEAEAAEAERREEEEAKEAERREAEERRSDAVEYAEKVDSSIASPSRAVMFLYLHNARAVREGAGPEVAASTALEARNFFDSLFTVLNTNDVSAPDSLGLNDVVTAMRDAAEGMMFACDELLKAIDTGSPSALAREASYRGTAIETWNTAMRDIYGAAERKPVLWPASRR